MKIKIANSVKNRFKLTGSGKIKRRRAKRKHYLEHKSSKLTRKLKKNILISKKGFTAIKKMLV